MFYPQILEKKFHYKSQIRMHLHEYYVE
jgi:hypothetical protein